MALSPEEIVLSISMLAIADKLEESRNESQKPKMTDRAWEAWRVLSVPLFIVFGNPSISNTKADPMFPKNSNHDQSMQTSP